MSLIFAPFWIDLIVVIVLSFLFDWLEKYVKYRFPWYKKWLEINHKLVPIHRVWYIYFAVCTSASLFSLFLTFDYHALFAQNWSCLLKNLLYNFSLWYLVFRTNLNQSGPIKNQWSSLLVYFRLRLAIMWKKLLYYFRRYSLSPRKPGEEWERSPPRGVPKTCNRSYVTAVMGFLIMNYLIRPKFWGFSSIWCQVSTNCTEYV